MARQGLPDVRIIRADLPSLWATRWDFLDLHLGAILGGTLFTLFRFLAVESSWSEFWADHWEYYFWSCASYLLVSALFAVRSVKQSTKPYLRRNHFLRLDREALTYSRGASKRRWLWRDLSDFDYDADDADHCISFLQPGIAPRWLRKVQIQDIYEMPTSEIADTLNKFRARALAEGHD